MRVNRADDGGYVVVGFHHHRMAIEARSREKSMRVR